MRRWIRDLIFHSPNANFINDDTNNNKKSYEVVNGDEEIVRIVFLVSTCVSRNLHARMQ